jgi:predicted nucleic acid-binding protein
MIIVDSTVWVDYFRGVENSETIWLEQGIGREPIALIDLILCEVLQGIRSDSQFETVKAELSEFDVFDSGGVEMAMAASANYRQLKTKGYTVRKTIDCWIATFCLRGGHALLHRDKDFDPFESVFGLKIIRTWNPVRSNRLT